MWLEAITIVAIILGPILAVQAQSYVEKAREKKKKQFKLFEILMSTRANRLSFRHVNALNSIDTTFYSNQAVLNAHQTYLNHLNSPYHKENTDASRALQDWINTADDLYVDILQKIAKEFDLTFDVKRLKMGIYNPRGHNELNDEEARLRKALLAITESGKSINVSLIKEDLHQPE